MPTLATRFNWGAEILNLSTILYNQLSESYTSIAGIINTKASKTQQTTDPPSTGQINANYDIGDLWVNTSTDTAWIMSSRTSATDVIWTQIT